jgi:3-oxoacyl-[acyl-carrier-protein] synthase-3
MFKPGILGTGHYVPEKIITNFDLEKMVDTSDEWIRTRTGIEQRRQAAQNEYTSDMGVNAAKKAIKNANLDLKDIDLVITATITGDYPWPSTATVIANKLGLSDVPAFDISAACSGFIYGLKLASSLIRSGDFKNILLIASEKLSAITDYTDRNTCVLLGDGAGAVIIGRTDNGEILSTVIHSDGSKLDLLYQPGGGCVNPASEETVKNRMHYLKMNGAEVFKLAVEKMPEVLEKALNNANVKPEQVDFVIFHQANIRIINNIAKRFNWPEEKNIVNIQKYGNTSAATIPIALSEAIEQGRIKKGNIIALSAFGAGLTWAGAVIKL